MLPPVAGGEDGVLVVAGAELGEWSAAVAGWALVGATPAGA